MPRFVEWLPDIAFHQLWLGALVAAVAWLAIRMLRRGWTRCAPGS